MESDKMNPYTVLEKWNRLNSIHSYLQKDGEQLYAYFQNGLSLIKELGQLLRRIAIPDMSEEEGSMEVNNTTVVASASTSCYV